MGAVIKCFVIYPFQKMNNLAASFSKNVFLLYKLYNYFSPSDIPSNNENNKSNQDIQQLFAVLDPGVVLQFQVFQSTCQDLVAFQVHPADLPRRFQQSFKLDRPSSLINTAAKAPWAQGLVLTHINVTFYFVKALIPSRYSLLPY